MSYRTDPGARRQLLEWLADKGLSGLPSEIAETDHLVAACGAALATWNWSRGQPCWLRPNYRIIRMISVVDLARAGLNLV